MKMKADDMLATLAATPLFAGLPPQELAEVGAIAAHELFDRDAVVFSEGDAAHGFYILVSGRVKVFKVALEGKEQILHIFGPGEPIGEVPVFSGGLFPASAQTLERSSFLYISREAFLDLVRRKPDLALDMLALLAARLRQFTVQIENLSLKEVPQRLAAYLVYLCGEQGDRRQVRLEISKGQLASLLGTIPETLSRMLSRMSSQGLIQVQGSMIDILDYQGLVDLAE